MSEKDTIIKKKRQAKAVKEFKRGALRVFFCIEIIIFFSAYLFGINGIQALMRLQEENLQLETELASMHEGVQELENEIYAWNSQPFYKEKIAREHLQMACTDDTVYYVA